MAYYESKTDQQSEFTIWYDNELGCVPRHFHRCLELIYLLEGELEMTSDEDTLSLLPNQIFCADSFTPHSLADVNGNSAAIVVIIPSFLASDFSALFQKQFFEPILQNVQYNKNVILPILQLFRLNRDTKNLNRVTNPYKNRFTERGITNIIIGQLLAYKLVPKKEQDKNLKLLVSVLKYINEHYKENLTLDKIANQFNYNKYYISKLFNKTIKQNLRTYINTLRFQSFQTEMTAAQDPLATLEDMMVDYGFSSSSTFYRAQKKIKEKE